MSVALAAGRRAAGLGAWPLLFAVLGAAIVESSGSTRALVAVLVAMLLVPLAMSAPQHALVATLAFLPFLALVRRMLLDFEPWHSVDPILVVAPIVALTLLIPVFTFERRSLTGDAMSSLVVGILVMTLLQTANPRGGSLAAGAGALLFTAAPMLWFFVGRELVDDRTMRRLFATLVPVGLAVALYGLLQTSHGLPHWDREWLSTTSLFWALNVGNRIRAFGTFSSAAEYATYLGVAVVIGVAFLRRVFLLPMLMVPVACVAVFLESSRGVVVSIVAALVVMAGARVAGARGVLVASAVAAVGIYVSLHAFGTTLQARAAATQNPFITHQVNGLVDPLNPQQSTFLLHWHGLLGGVRAGIHSPLGSGIASTTLAGSKLGAVAHGTELDVSDAFVGLGALGGVLYLAFVLVALRNAFRLAIRRRDRIALAALGILLVCLGQWLNGAYYALSPLVWIVLGWIAAAQRPVLAQDDS